MDKQKLIHQLFVGKVADVIGWKETTALLKEAREAFNAIPKKQTSLIGSAEEVGKCSHRNCSAPVYEFGLCLKHFCISEGYNTNGS